MIQNPIPAQSFEEIRAPWRRALYVCFGRMTQMQRESVFEEIEAICANEFSTSLFSLDQTVAPSSALTIREEA